jgi:hypothetical protein
MFGTRLTAKLHTILDIRADWWLTDLLCINRLKLETNTTQTQNEQQRRQREKTIHATTVPSHSEQPWILLLLLPAILLPTLRRCVSRIKSSCREIQRAGCLSDCHRAPHPFSRNGPSPKLVCLASCEPPLKRILHLLFSNNPNYPLSHRLVWNNNYKNVGGLPWTQGVVQCKTLGPVLTVALVYQNRSALVTVVRHELDMILIWDRSSVIPPR